MELRCGQQIRKRVLAGGLMVCFGLAAVCHSSALLPADLHEALEGFGFFCMALAVLGWGWSWTSGCRPMLCCRSSSVSTDPAF